MNQNDICFEITNMQLKKNLSNNSTKKWKGFNFFNSGLNSSTENTVMNILCTPQTLS